MAARRPSSTDVGVDEALAHPTWSMGPKITIDSSTLMNKGLEVIEAHELFGAPYDHIEVVVHPQSIVHSMVEFTDGSTIAQLSHARHAPADRLRPRLPRAHRHPVRAHRLVALERLDFEPPDLATFRCLALAYEAGRAGGSAPAWLSAANEVAVEAFLDGRHRLEQIADVCNRALDRHDQGCRTTIEEVVDGRRAARAVARRAGAGIGAADEDAAASGSSEGGRYGRFRNEVMAGGSVAEECRGRAATPARPGSSPASSSWPC